MSKLTLILWVSALAVCFFPQNVEADGMFVVPKFVWDKHKDINEPTQKAIIVYDAGQEDMILQVKYQGPVNEFGWLVPAPNLPTVKDGSMKCFYELSQYTQKNSEQYDLIPGNMQAEANTLGVEAASAPPPVKVVEIKTVGAYKIAVLSAKDSGALKKWLDDNQFYFPADKMDVIDSYIQRQWYFIAVRINLGSFRNMLSTRRQLATGELNPLQISFASDRCVFPLKISSANGRPSEVQVYVLSPQPLVEEGMLKLPLVYSNDMAQAQQIAKQMEQANIYQERIRRQMMNVNPMMANAPDQEEMARERRKTPALQPDELVPYMKLASADLPDCARSIPRLAGKKWWLMKETWTFQPEEMHDLEFDPAIPFFSDQLGTKYGYYAAATLAEFGKDAVPSLLSVLQSTNEMARVNAASIFGEYATSDAISDPQIKAAAVGWLSDPLPEVRRAAVDVLVNNNNWDPKNARLLVGMLHDKDVEIREVLMSSLSQYENDMRPFVPKFKEMLKDPDENVRINAMQMLQRMEVELPKPDLVAFFTSSNLPAVGMAFSLLSRQDEVSDDDAAVLLQNPLPMARMFGLRALSRNSEKRSVDLALPLLQDTNEAVRMGTARMLRGFTGQDFDADEVSEWQKWWAQNKAAFVPPPATPLYSEVQMSGTLYERQLRRQSDEEWELTPKRQTQVPEILAAKWSPNPGEFMQRGHAMVKDLRNDKIPGADKLSLEDLLTLKQVITGREPEDITFELPIRYDVMTKSGRLRLMVDAPSERFALIDSSGLMQDLERAPNGDCLLVWHTIYDTPGEHALQVSINWRNDSDGFFMGKGPAMLFVNSNLCQFNLYSSYFNQSAGAIYRARLPETNGTYIARLVTTNGAPLKTITGNTTDGRIDVRWNMVNDNGQRFTGENFNSIWQISLPGSGRTQTLRGP
ncbi:MAG TPA: DUF2330 domain-containing protein [Verrucomicrobiae bacterium]